MHPLNAMAATVDVDIAWTDSVILVGRHLVTGKRIGGAGQFRHQLLKSPRLPNRWTRDFPHLVKILELPAAEDEGDRSPDLSHRRKPPAGCQRSIPLKT